jgi:hypothetical protein
MKKFTLILMMMIIFTGLAMSQTIENFESLKMNVMNSGANGAFSVIPNPDSTAENPSFNVAQFVRGADGTAYAGFYATLATPIDLDANKYVHVKVWKPVTSTVTFKLENPNIEVNSINQQTIENGWEELVFDFSAASGSYTKIVFVPDNIDPTGRTEDIVIYFDDLTINNDPTVGSAAVQVMEDFEYIPLNLMIDDKINDLSKMELSPNPDISDVNLSPYVIKFLRDKDGLIWDGFWSTLPTPIDVTTNKYLHVKVWKPRISIMKFKIEGGAAGTLEIPSMNPQTLTNQWEDIVFDFSEKTGTYPVIAFLPDFSDPVNLTSDITIYFDDIILNNDPNPVTGPPQQVFNVDMNGSPMVSGQQVFISGAFGGINGQWAEPGTIPENEMFDLDGDGIYTITMQLPDGVIAFKFFINSGTGWGTGDDGPGDRTYIINGSANLNYVWGVEGLSNVGVPKNTLSGKVQMYPNPVNNLLNIKTTTDVNSVTISSMLGQVIGSYSLASKNNLSISTSTLSNGMYFVTFVGKDGSKLTEKLIKK